jgi:cytochrome P450
MAQAATATARADMTWIRSHAEAQEILKSRDFVPTLHKRASYPIVGESLMTLEGADHLTRRRTEIVMFSRPALLEYEFDLVGPAIRSSVAELISGGSGPIKVDFLRVIRDALLRVSARIVGLDDVDTMDATDRLLAIAERLSEGASLEWVTDGADRILAAALAAKEEFDATFFGASVARREALIAQWQASEIDESALPNDLVTILLRAYESWDRDKLLREAIFFLVAGSSTTTHAAPHVLREVLGWLAVHPEDLANTSNLPFLQRSVSEALRLHPPVPALLRESLRDVELTSGRVVAAADEFAVDLNAANRDESVFGPTAADFNPHRAIPARVSPYGESFGEGVHVCPGRMVAVGAANGSIQRADQPAGVLVRLLEELLKQQISLDPDDLPALRTDTSTNRYATFPVILTVS